MKSILKLYIQTPSERFLVVNPYQPIIKGA